MGFAFPKEERDALVASEPGKFLLPGRSDLRAALPVLGGLDRPDSRRGVPAGRRHAAVQPLAPRRLRQAGGLAVMSCRQDQGQRCGDTKPGEPSWRRWTGPVLARMSPATR